MNIPIWLKKIIALFIFGILMEVVILESKLSPISYTSAGINRIALIIFYIVFYAFVTMKYLLNQSISARLKKMFWAMLLIELINIAFLLQFRR